MVQERIQAPLELIQRRLGGLTPREVAGAGVGASIPRRRYRDGLIDQPGFVEEMAQLGHRGSVIAEQWIMTVLEADTATRSDMIAAYRQAYRKERISMAELELALHNQGVRADEIQVIVFAEQARQALEDPSIEDQELKASGAGTVQRRYREGLILGPEFIDEMVALRYKAPEIDRYQVLSDLEFDANMRLELLAAYRSGVRTDRLSQGQFHELLLELGIRPELAAAYLDQEILRRKLDPPTPEELELRGTGSGTVISRYREGWTGPDEFRSEMLSLRYTDQEIDRYLVLADLSADLDFKSDVLGYLRDAFRRDEISADEFLRTLESFGMDQARATVHLAREQVKRLPTVRIPAPPPPLAAYLTRAGKLRVREAIERFRNDELTPPELRQRLQVLEMDDELLEATVDLELARKGITVLGMPAEVLPFYETDQGKIRLRTVLEAFRRELIDPEDVVAALFEQERQRRIPSAVEAMAIYQELLELEMVVDLARAYVDYELVRRTPTT